jgi:hypothetical protein
MEGGRPMANRIQLYQYKGNRCTHCGLSVQEMLERYGSVNKMFEFNHVDPGKKHPDYDNLIERVLSGEQLDEVDKCVLLCRQCHGVLHAQHITCELLVRVKVGTKRAEQRFKGQMIFDYRDRRATFLTNERVLLHPYRVSLGRKRPRFLFGTDLEKNLFNVYIQKILDYQTIVVRSWKGREMFRAEYKGGNEIAVNHAINFQLLYTELCDDQGKPTIWIRNGIGLSKKGEIFRSGTVKYKFKLPLQATSA